MAAPDFDDRELTRLVSALAGETRQELDRPAPDQSGLRRVDLRACGAVLHDQPDGQEYVEGR